MREFMLLVKKTGDFLEELSPEQQQQHVQKVGKYIGGLMESGALKGAQPLELTGAVVTRENGIVKDGPFTETKEVINGYFHIQAENLEAAVAIARANPIFEDTDVTIDVRPIKYLEGIN